MSNIKKTIEEQIFIEEQTRIVLVEKNVFTILLHKVRYATDEEIEMIKLRYKLNKISVNLYKYYVIIKDIEGNSCYYWNLFDRFLIQEKFTNFVIWKKITNNQ